LPLWESSVNGDGWAAVMELWEHAQKLGISGPDCYLFRACEHERIDASRPIKTWRTAWRSLTKAAGLPGLGFHRLRHQVVTELLEAGHSDEVVRQIVGHVDARMTRRYPHIRREIKRKALESLSSRPSSRPGMAGNVTKNVTRPQRREEQIPQAVEKMVGTWGLEPQTSTVSR
jgi:hypothetical protein